MLALSIRQPWAWLILNAGKDIENRDWPTRVRGTILIHAGKGMTHDEYENGLDACSHVGGVDIWLPPFEALERGGIVGQVDIVSCVESWDSPWFQGRYGFVLQNPKRMPFQPYRGRLGFFSVVPAPAVREGP